ncbi:MAG TPA: chlorite dismutase family protein [Terriglobales bacterium]|nr:chlorite dismutase family protein [Terriglobales bacterium]
METELSPKQPQPAESDREFLKYTFFKVDPQWRCLPEKERDAGRQEFSAAFDDASKQIMVKSYSLIGIRGDSDFMFWSISRRLEDLQSFVVRLLSTKLGKYLSTPYSYLALTRRSEYLAGHQHEGQEGVSLGRRPSEAKYMFLYPFTKKREWYFLPHEERRIMMAQHFKLGHKYPSVKINTGYSFGLDDQEFMLAFETDNPVDFSELVMEMRSSEASRYTALETPLFTCIAMGVNEILSQL